MPFCFFIQNFAEIWRSMNYGQKTILKMAVAAILNVTWLSLGSLSAVVYQILSKSDDFSLRYGDFAIFKIAAVRHLGFVMTSQYCIAGHIFVVQILSWNFLSIGDVVSEIPAISYKPAFWLYITDHGNFGVAHALCHLTLSRGSKITTRMNFLPLFVYSLRHFYVSTMTIKRCSKGSIPISPVKNGPQNGANSGKWGSRC